MFENQQITPTTSVPLGVLEKAINICKLTKYLSYLVENAIFSAEQMKKPSVNSINIKKQRDIGVSQL